MQRPAAGRPSCSAGRSRLNPNRSPAPRPSSTYPTGVPRVRQRLHVRAVHLWRAARFRHPGDAAARVRAGRRRRGALLLPLHRPPGGPAAHRPAGRLRRRRLHRRHRGGGGAGAHGGAELRGA
jgi:hypothetical protein